MSKNDCLNEKIAYAYSFHGFAIDFTRSSIILINMLYGLFYGKDSLYNNLLKELRESDQEKATHVNEKVTMIKGCLKLENFHIRNQLTAHIISDNFSYGKDNHSYVGGYFTLLQEKLILDSRIDFDKIIDNFSALIDVLIDKNENESCNSITDESERFRLITNLKLYKAYIWTSLGSKKLRKKYYHNICDKIEKFKKFGFIKKSISINKYSSLTAKTKQTS